MSSGVKVSQESKSMYEQLKSKKKSIRYVIFKIVDGFVQIEKTGGRETKYKDFLEEIKKLDKECRYFLYDYPGPCKSDENQTLDKLLLVAWCPETSPVKSKMLYASSLDAVKRAFEGLKYVQATGMDEVDEAAILEQLHR